MPDAFTELPLIAARDLVCEARSKKLRTNHTGLAAWATGSKVFTHGSETQCRIHDLHHHLSKSGTGLGEDGMYRMLQAADDITRAAMWAVVHMTYARRVFLDGRPLGQDDFKPEPEGHTGGSLNMVPAYVGYLLANALSGVTRSWIMGQGHCVAAIEAVNVLLGNLSVPQLERYSWSEEGLSHLVTDFYGYAIDAKGHPSGLVGSHVNANTAGGISEGGYLGFAEVEYVHMPLKGERLVAFLSDGAFEEQRGSDWAPRWWRHQDSGLVGPVMILNGRRIEQRTEMAQEGGASWLRQHLAMCGFDPIDIDGRDPAAFAWAIIEMEERLSARGEAASRGETAYPVPLPYTIANTIKGFGFPGEGSIRAHNLPLYGNPSRDPVARDEFNEGAARLWVEPKRLAESVRLLQNHAAQGRVPEREHALAKRNVPTPRLPDWKAQDAPVGKKASPMAALDRQFIEIIKVNSGLRPRVGNPDELQSNKMGETLKFLKHRVNRPEAGVAEAVDGAIITVLNEEAVIGAALGNKGGINLTVTYEAFAVKMLGAIRQEIIFARAQKDRGYSPGWLGIPVVVTSHTWENGKNEQSHQDPTFCEALLGEMSDTARVLFPADAASAVAALRHVYSQHGQIACLVVAKRDVTAVFNLEAAENLVSRGVAHVSGQGDSCDIQLVAVGAYQLEQCSLAARRMAERGMRPLVTYLLEPGKFRFPRDEREAAFVASSDIVSEFLPRGVPRCVVSHTRPEPIAGVLRPLDEGPVRTRFLGYRNRGGTLNAAGLLFANSASWAHIVAEACKAMGREEQSLLSPEEIAAIKGVGNPSALMR